jgi:hypothetical protein
MPEAYLERAEVLLLDALFATAADIRTSRYSGRGRRTRGARRCTCAADRYPPRGGARLSPPAAPFGSRSAILHERAASLRAAMVRGPADVEEAFIELAAERGGCRREAMM